MNYSLFIMVMKWKIMPIEAKGQPGAALAVALLLSFQSSVLFHIFCVSLLPEIARGVIYIVGFRSRWIRGGKEIQKRAHELGCGPHHAARKFDRVVDPFSYLMALHVDFFLECSSFPWKMVGQKIGSIWHHEVPKTQKYIKIGVPLIES
jgi:hypothetical protein